MTIGNGNLNIERFGLYSIIKKGGSRYERNEFETRNRKLENLFSKFNEKFYNGELQTPVITVSPDTTKGAYGWCTAWKAWSNGEQKKITDLATLTKTSLNDEAKAFVAGMQDKKFELHRKSLPKIPGAAKTKQSSRKYVCPVCGCIIRATKEVHVICGDCNVEFEEEA